MRDADTEGLLTRDGHVTDLTLDRLALGSLSDAERQAVEDHLQSCDACWSRSEAVAGFDADFQAAPLPDWLPTQDAAVIPLAERRSKSRQNPWILGTLIAAAAAVLLVVAIEPPTLTDTGQPDDGILIKGANFDLQIHLEDDSGSRPAVTGDEVHPGQRIGFEVMAREPGHLMIIGVDEKHEGYLCYPQHAEGLSTPMTASDKSVALGEAMRLDDVLGRERIVALLCPEPFSFESIRSGLEQAERGAGPGERLGTIRVGCQQREVVLHKRSRSK